MAGRAYFSHQCCICCNSYLQISKEVVVSGAAIRDLRLVRGSKLQAAFRPAWHAFVPLFLGLSPHDKEWFFKIWILHAMMDVVVQREFDAIAPRMHMSYVSVSWRWSSAFLYLLDLFRALYCARKMRDQFMLVRFLVPCFIFGKMGNLLHWFWPILEKAHCTTDWNDTRNLYVWLSQENETPMIVFPSSRSSLSINCLYYEYDTMSIIMALAFYDMTLTSRQKNWTCAHVHGPWFEIPSEHQSDSPRLNMIPRPNLYILSKGKYDIICVCYWQKDDIATPISF